MLSLRLFIITSLYILLIGLFTSSVFAYEVILEDVTIPYEAVQLLGNHQQTKIILGELQDVPEMYEVVIEATSTLSIAIRAVPKKDQQPVFSSIIIKQKEIRGIEEIARLSATDATWNRLVDRSTGLAFLSGPNFTGTVTPGTYKIEVSNPNNQGKYLLILGSDDDNQSYVESLRAIITTYEFYDTNKFKVISSPYIYYPIGIFLILIIMAVIFYKNRYRFIRDTQNYHA